MRRILATVAALGLAFPLAACGDDKAATEVATPQVVTDEQTVMVKDDGHDHTEGDGHDHDADDKAGSDKAGGDKMAANADINKLTCDELGKIADGEQAEATFLALTKAAGKSPEDDNDVLDVTTKVTEFCVQSDNLGKPIVEGLK